MTGIDRIGDPLVSGASVRKVSDVDGCIDAVLDDEGSGTEVLDTEVFAADDRELLRRVRAGEDAAFAELFSRHAGVARSFALRYANDVAEAEDIAAEAFFRVLQAVRRGSGPDDNVRGYLLTVIRRLAAEWRTRRRDVPVADEELSRRVDPDADQAGTRAEANLIARAFTSLPQRWRKVLWQVEVEGERPAVVAPHFGLSPNATAALARRAREGLRAAYLQAHVPSATASTACRSVIDKLGAYTAGLVRGSEAQRVLAHLSGCASCRSVHAELADVCAGLRRYAGMLPVPIMAPALLHQPSLTPSSLAAKSSAAGNGLAGKGVAGKALVGKGLAGKSAALAGKAAAFGVRFKLAVATMSVVVVGGLGITAGPLLLHMTSHLAADRGTVQLPVLPNGPASGSADSAARPFGPQVQESTGTAIAGPRAHQSNSGASSDSAAVSSSSDSATGQSQGGGQPQTSGGASQGSGGSGPSEQDLNPDSQNSATSPNAPMSPNIASHNLTPQQTSTVVPTTDPTTVGQQRNPVVSSTEYTTDGTTVWITKWTWFWTGQAPPGN